MKWKLILKTNERHKICKVTLDIDIENIFKIKNIYNHRKRHWITIYEVIQQEFFDKTDILPEDFLRYFNKNKNVLFNIPTYVRNNLNRMATEQGLYAQVIMLRRNYLKITEEDSKMRINSSSRVSLQDTSFGVILVLVGLKKSTNEPNLYKNCFQRHDETQDKNTFKMFLFPIGNSKNMEEMKFHIDAPMLKYRQSTSNSCRFSSLVSAFDCINQTKAANDISKYI